MIPSQTASALKTFCLAMSLHPEVQRKAHAELDAVVGHDRLPDFSDRDSLPYLNAIIKESLRWMSVTPLGLAHCTTEDDEFGGYFIPAGSIVMANIWWDHFCLAHGVRCVNSTYLQGMHARP